MSSMGGRACIPARRSLAEAQSGANWTEETKQNFKSYSEAVSPSPRPLLAAGLLARRQPFAGTILRPEKKYLWLHEIRRECKIQTMERNIKMGQQLVTALPRSPFASPCLLRACPEVVSRGGKSLRVKKAIRLEEGTKRRGEQQKKQEGGKSAKSAMIPFAPHASPFVEGSDIDLETCNYLIIAPCI